MDILGVTDVPTWAVPDLVCFTVQYSKVVKHFLNFEKIYHDQLLHFYRFFDEEACQNSSKVFGNYISPY